MKVKSKKVKVIMLPAYGDEIPMIIKKDGILSTPNDNYTSETLREVGFEIYHLYFISDNEIKIGDWNINHLTDKISKRTNSPMEINKNQCSKIIATTDPSLNLPKPSQAFVQKYCELNSIGEVMVELKEDKLKVNSHNEITIHSIKNSWNREELFDNMQYYMEYCQKNSYITPQEWLETKKHF